ncbi:MAG: 3-oxoacyl-[acyl-carrier-protein] reductase [Candidatus Handelsmanbacteria bacterium RIFCSPLOWO2_12_FULL_64_10]|uniref:3-oxoacyl-[acyl-carrier-protein] reductase n=1 Tax=Handelsmanbacteria sp. (strain RIFCSPLOWO2_12_FULL_64_10) TaxID=1817868 RepID=A0A1F6CKV2_HANXR|nr:MAG: 3-oxoacyl-[acyl-carrier-protein] reductase [Candidatus Handelsmanbacteria bacterium RIFCSPLOWO2_12_FULL_64_10]
MNRLEGQVAIVTGGSRGIGEAVVVRLATEGADVALCASRSVEAAERVAGQVRGLGRRALVAQVDVSDAAAVDPFVASVISAFGRLDILVNNAGTTRDGLLLRMDDEAWDRVMDVNLKGAFHTIRAAARPMMRARRGRIVNISSVVGLRGNAAQANYAASKAGLIGLTKSVAREFASRGITANAVAPGYIPTEMTEGLPPDVKEALLAQAPMGRPGSAADVAATVAFLASDDAAYITGQVIVVDGGMTM